MFVTSTLLICALLQFSNALECYEGNDLATVVRGDYKYCVISKDTETKLKTYSGSNKDVDLSNDTCYIQYDHASQVLNVHCYCATDRCNVPSMFPKKW